MPSNNLKSLNKKALGIDGSCIIRTRKEIQYTVKFYGVRMDFVCLCEIRY